jgi:rubrerythrin
MLSTRVKTTTDLMSIALQAEREAIRRYAQLTRDMREGGNDSTAALFERMVTEEREHESLLLEWMAKESIVANSDIGPIHWRDPHVSTTYNDEARDPHYSTPYKALAFAVNNEENAFRFYTHVAAESDNEAVRKYAEILAREELGHAALLRAERRLAFHAERDINPVGTAPDPRAIHNETELLATAIQIDRYFADAISKIDTDSPQLTALTRETRQQISHNENALNRIAPNHRNIPGAEIPIILGQADSNKMLAEDESDSLDSKLQRLSIYCDLSFVFYDAIVETTTDETMMRTAQTLTSSALDRMAVLKQIIGNE